MNKTSASGSSKQPRSGKIAQPPKKPTVLPKVLPYPKLHSLSKTISHLKNHLCYIVRHYGTNGISVLIFREPKLDKVSVLCGDWNGNNLDLDNSTLAGQAALIFVKEDLQLFLGLMQCIKLNQAQFFFAFADDGQLVLVDVQVSFDKLIGPGMIKDIFGKIYRTQEIIKIETVDDRVIECLGMAIGSYAGELILKPSKFKTFVIDDEMVPLYSEIKRS